MDSFSAGFAVGMLVGEGHFGGDGKQPHVVLKMHVRRRATLERLVAIFPGSKLYGPYSGGGRTWFQWMARGKALREGVVPEILRHPEWLDDHVRYRLQRMCRRYDIPFALDSTLDNERPTLERPPVDRPPPAP